MAFALALLSKPRRGRFPNLRPSSRSYDLSFSTVSDIAQHQQKLKSGSNLSISCLGLILSVFGNLSILSHGGNVLFHCFLSISASAITSSGLSWLFTKQWSFCRMRGGILIGLVVISACANDIYRWSAFVLGCLAGKCITFPKIAINFEWLHYKETWTFRMKVNKVIYIILGSRL